jgi:hypothetical protein
MNGTSSPPSAAGEERHEVVVDWTEFDRLPEAERHRFIHACERRGKRDWFSGAGCEWALIDLAQYKDYRDFVRCLKKTSAAFYEARKAAKQQYYSKFFDPKTFVGDIVAINGSAPRRQGRPMEGPYCATVEDLGGHASAIGTPAAPTQNVYWLRNFGVFRTCPGCRQGNLVVDEQLLAYTTVRRFGNFAEYATIIGHADYLKEGVVYKTHLDFIEMVLQARRPVENGAHDPALSDLRYIGYLGMSYWAPGLMRWKKNNLFRPKLLSFDYGKAYRLPSHSRGTECPVTATADFAEIAATDRTGNQRFSDTTPKSIATDDNPSGILTFNQVGFNNMEIQIQLVVEFGASRSGGLSTAQIGLQASYDGGFNFNLVSAFRVSGVTGQCVPISHTYIDRDTHELPTACGTLYRVQIACDVHDAAEFVVHCASRTNYHLRARGLARTKPANFPAWTGVLFGL